MCIIEYLSGYIIYIIVIWSCLSLLFVRTARWDGFFPNIHLKSQIMWWHDWNSNIGLNWKKEKARWSYICKHMPVVQTILPVNKELVRPSKLRSCFCKWYDSLSSVTNFYNDRMLRLTSFNIGHYFIMFHLCYIVWKVLFGMKKKEYILVKTLAAKARIIWLIACLIQKAVV